MPKKRSIKIELSAKDEALVHYEMEWGRNESIRGQAAILYYANQGTATQKELCEKTGHDQNVYRLHMEENVQIFLALWMLQLFRRSA